MKLISAGQGMTVKPYTELLFNCTRNQKCQRLFFVPVNQFSDIVFFADLAGEPTLIAIDVVNVCGEVDGSAISTQYVAGTKPDGTWYGVFAGLVVTPPVGVTYTKFFFRFTFTIAGIEHVFYSEQFEFPYCETLTPIRGCYPNESVGSDAEDCNGIYYGFPNNPDDALGDPEYRYIHKAFLRMAEVLEQSNKMKFTAFNNKQTYKNVFTREWLFQFELVPTFFKDVLVGIFNRGNVQIFQEGVWKEWKLAETQDISMIDNDAKLWLADITLDSECKQTFGCGVSDCSFPEPPPPTCDCEPEVTATVEIVVGCVAAGISSGGALPDGEEGIPYNHVINLSGTAPFTLGSIVKPSWMTINVVGSTIVFSGTPDADGDDIPVSFNILNCDEDVLPYSDTIDIAPFVCTEVGWTPEAELPEAQVGVPYLHDIPLTGSMPMTIDVFSVIKPSWMTIAIVSGNILRFSGTPDAAFTDFDISLTINNCAEGGLEIDTTLTITESIPGEMVFANCPDAPDTIDDIQFNGVSVIPTSGTFPMLPGDSMNFLVTNPAALGNIVVFMSGNTSGQPVRIEGTDSQPATSCQDGIGGATRTLFFFTVDNTNDISLNLLCGICP